MTPEILFVALTIGAGWLAWWNPKAGTSLEVAILTFSLVNLGMFIVVLATDWGEYFYKEKP